MENGSVKKNKSLINSTSTIISSDFLPKGEDSLSKVTTERCQKIVDAYGSHAIKWIWSVNASDTNPLHPPTGFFVCR